MTYSADQISRDFDRIAAARAPVGWNHNNHYHAFLLRQLPARCGSVLDVGCGTGQFTRRLAARADVVRGVDLSPVMIHQAREESGHVRNVSFEVGDFLSLPYPSRSFDAIATIAALHHVPIAPAFRRLDDLLKPGGRLLILDLFASGYGRDLLWKAPAMVVEVGFAFVHNRHRRPSSDACQAWAQHEAHDHLLSLGEIRDATRQALPGALVQQHLFWRVSIIWQKPI